MKIKISTLLVPAVSAIAGICISTGAAYAMNVVVPDAKPTAEQTATAEQALSSGDRGLEFTVGMTDLNDDGRPDLIARFDNSLYCGSAGCAGFVVMATAKGYRHRVINLPNFQEKLTVLNQRHHGMHDLRFDDARYVFTWNGKAYR